MVDCRGYTVLVGQNSYARTQGLKGVNKMERSESIAKIVDSIYNAVTLEIHRGKLVEGSELAGTGIFVSQVSMKDNIRMMILNVLYLSDDSKKEFRARGQYLIDWSLKVFADILASLFEKQKKAREYVEKTIVRGENDSVPRNILRHFLWEERATAEAIEIRKREFDELLTAAKELGFEVFERSENRYHVYRVLEVNSLEIARDLKL